MSVIPQKTEIIKYGYDGSAIASIGVAEHSVPQNGRHTVQFTNNTGKQQPLSKSTISFNSLGLPSLASSVIYDPTTSATTSHVASDFSSLQWSKGNRPTNGSVTATCINSKAGRRHKAEYIFAQEQVQSAKINHYSLDKGTPQGSTEVNLSGTVRLGSRICGGHILITNLRNNGTLSTKSSVSLSKFGLVILLVMQTFDTDGTTLKQTSTWDYSNVVFNPRRKVDSGTLAIKTTDSKNVLLSSVTYTLENGKATRVEVALADGTQSTYNYPALVSPAAKVSQQSAPSKPVSRQSASAQRPCPVSSTDEPTDGQKKVVTVKRADGTLERVTLIWYTAEQRAGKTVETPVRGIVTSYSTDGKTIIETKALDFTKAQFGGDGHDITGSIQVRSSSAGLSLANSTLQF